MTPDPLLLFPLAALVLVVLYPALGRNGNAPRSLASRVRRRQLLGRAAVITLPTSAVVADMWPLWPAPYFGKAAQALLLFTIVMLTLVTVHIIVTRRQRRNRVRGAVSTASGASRRPRTLIGETAPTGAAKSASNTEDHPAESSTGGWSLTALQPGGEAGAPADSASYRGERSDEPEAVRAWTGRRVERLDPREPEDATPSSVESGGVVSRSPPVPSVASETTTNPESASALKAVALELRGMRGREIVELVHALRTDRARLRQLVVARHAACVSERRARERAHAVTRDAVGALRRARASQRLAEKVARRERRERPHAVARYERTARVLSNAVSIIESGRHACTGGEVERGTIRPEAGGEGSRELETH